MILRSRQISHNINHQLRKELAMSCRLIRRSLLLSRLPPEPPDEFQAPAWKKYLVWMGIGALSILFYVVLAMFLICFDSKDAKANEIVRIAESQIGKGEIGGNNRGLEVERYTKGKDCAWCAAFVSWVLSRSGHNEHYFLSARSYWKAYANKKVERPQPGDLIIFKRGSFGGHIGIVEKIQGQTVTTIEGNVGRYPARVREFKYHLNHIPHLLGFVRII